MFSRLDKVSKFVATTYIPLINSKNWLLLDFHGGDHFLRLKGNRNDEGLIKKDSVNSMPA